ncbi:MAG TPA: hypothetical protein VLC51_08850 [Nitrospira sp.]|nr:hypothetical protein [Nitrospira sp.]
MLKIGFPQSSRPRVVEIPRLSVADPGVSFARGKTRRRYESQSQTFDVRG